MSYTLRIPPPVETYLRHLHPGIKPKIRCGLEDISKNPHAGKALTPPLTGFHSYRVVSYRIVYQINAVKKWIEIVDIDHRKIIYEKLKIITSE